MNDWIHLFDVRDLKGKYAERDLDRVVSSYDPGFHECPLVDGYPREDSESYGWIQGLKREGQSVYARFKQFVPEVLAGLQRGFYKKHSVSFYRDLQGRGPYLRHFGFSSVAGVSGGPRVMVFLEDQFSSFAEFEFIPSKEKMMSQEISAERLLRNFLGVEFSEGNLESKVCRARQSLGYNPSVKGRCTAGDGDIEVAVAAEALSELKGWDFSESLKQIRHFAQSA